MNLAEQEPSPLARDHVGISLDSAARLGRRTAELHLALASPTGDPAFMPETLTAGDVQSLLAGLRKEAAGVLDLLKDSIAGLPDDLIDLAGLVLGRTAGQDGLCRRRFRRRACPSHRRAPCQAVSAERRGRHAPVLKLRRLCRSDRLHSAPARGLGELGALGAAVGAVHRSGVPSRLPPYGSSRPVSAASRWEQSKTARHLFAGQSLERARIRTA